MKISERMAIKRLLVLSVLITFLFVCLGGRMAYIQLYKGKEYTAKALEQWLRDVPIVASRGKILDINGEILADTATTYTLFVRPNAVENKQQLSSVLADILGFSYDYVLEKISKKTSEVKIARQLTKEQKDEIVAQSLVGVYLSEDIKRVYPYSDFLTQVLGFTNVDGVGQAGLEAYYDTVLRGVNGYALTETDLVGRELSRELSYIPPIEGMNVNTTIDYHIQALAEREVKNAYADFDALSCSCCILDAASGGIVAMASAPSFDLNNIPRDDIAYLLSASRNSLLSDVYEPGSTFKIVTMAIAINEGLVKESDMFYCPGYKIVDGDRIKCWKSSGHGSITFAEGVEKSCNCVFMALAEKIGAEKMYEYYEKLGVTQKTGIDISGEGAGLKIALEKVKTVDLARIGFGQAIAVTPLNLTSVVAEIITGTKLTPHFVDSITSKDGDTVYLNKDYKKESIISKETASLVRRLLFNVVDKGSGKKAGVNGYSIGGKTGTAQKYENGSIARGKYISSFIGFYSVETPKYVVLFIVNEPKGYMYYGSLVAAPYVGKIFEGIMQYTNTAPDQEIEKEVFFPMPDLIGMSVTELTRTMRELGLTYELEGLGGRVIEQFPLDGTMISTRNVVYIGLSDKD